LGSDAHNPGEHFVSKTNNNGDALDRPVLRRVLGRTGLHVSCLSFGCGPVSGLMTGDDFESQAQTMETLVRLGINWIDTAAGYGNGLSETNIGRILTELPEEIRDQIHVATKVRIDCNLSLSVSDQVRIGLETSLNRLRLSKVSLLQLHNAITATRGDQPNSVSVGDVLDSGGILDALKSMQKEKQTGFIGLTGTGAVESMRSVVSTGDFDTIQVPYNLLNPSAGCYVAGDFSEQNYGNILSDCLKANMGCFAIRVFAGGALLGLPPGSHTLRTPYFPLDLYCRDLDRAVRLDSTGPNRARMAIKFALSHPAIHSAIIGFGAASHVTEAVRILSDRSEC
jgi:aryl-alcohol dehydrogenase-like predicted oxidoreductase